MTNDLRILSDLWEERGIVTTAGGHGLPYELAGKAVLQMKEGPIYLSRVLYVPDLVGHSLLAEITLTHVNKVGLEWDWDVLRVKLTNGNLIEYPITDTTKKMIFEGRHVINTEASANLACVSPSHDDTLLEHERLGHPGPAQHSNIVKRPVEQVDCGPCAMGKTTKARLPAHSRLERASEPLERLHTDILTQLTGHSKYRFALVVVDDKTSYTHVDPLISKGHAAQSLIDFASLAENQTGRYVKAIRSDNDSVFKSQTCIDWKTEKGIAWELTVTDDSRGNGKVERMNRVLRERMTALLAARAAPYVLWPEAIEYAAVCINLTPRRHGEKSPYEQFWGKPPTILKRFQKPFACLAWVFVPERKRIGGKGGPRSIPAIFIGIDSTRRGWKFYSPHTSPTTFWANSARFHEGLSWQDRRRVANWRELIDNKTMFADRGDKIADLSFSPIDILTSRDEECVKYYQREVEGEVDVSEEVDVVFDGERFTVVDEEEAARICCEEAGDWKGARRFPAEVGLTAAEGHEAAMVANTVDLQPSVKEALRSTSAPQWRAAIRKEIDGIYSMGVWEIVDLPPGVKPIGSRLLLRIKVAPDGTLIRHKARLVGQGFGQVYYEETFAPVAPYSAVRVIFVLAAAHNWFIHATDFAQAYLNGVLDEPVYMKPPEGYELPPGKVLKVVKGLYGLKQSGRVWNQKLDAALRKLEIMPLDAAPCVYTRGEGQSKIVIASYVDDLVLASPSLEVLESVKSALASMFKMEDKGAIDNFCGLEVKYDQPNGTLRLSQQGYIKSLVQEHPPSYAHSPCKTPLAEMLPSTQLDRDVQPSYRSKVGKLMWVANHTRPDIAFAAGVLARHLSSPSTVHDQAALRCVGYLAKTAHLDLTYQPRKEEGLVVYSDATWASDKTTNSKSTSGFCVMLYGCPVSWGTSLQRCVTASAVEAELVATSLATREVLFVKHLLQDLDFPITPTLRSDSQGCVQACKDPSQHWRLKHVETHYNITREAVQEGKMKIEYTPGPSNPADIFTKPVGRHIVERHRNALNVIS